MEFNCYVCHGTGLQGGEPCSVCGGDGKLDLTDDRFREVDHPTINRLHGAVWNSMLLSLADLSDKVNDVMDKCDDIFEKLPGSH